MDAWIVVGTVGSVIAALGTTAMLFITWWTATPSGLSFKVDKGVATDTGEPVVRVSISEVGGRVLYAPQVVVEGALALVGSAPVPRTIDVHSDPIVATFTLESAESPATVAITWLSGTRRLPSPQGAMLLLPSEEVVFLRRGWLPPWRLRWMRARIWKKRAREFELLVPPDVLRGVHTESPKSG